MGILPPGLPDFEPYRLAGLDYRSAGITTTASGPRRCARTNNVATKNHAAGTHRMQPKTIVQGAEVIGKVLIHQSFLTEEAAIDTV